MPTLSLNGEWQLYGFPAGSRSIDTPEVLFAAGLEALPAQVPGNVELDLQRAGLLPEPFFGENIRLLRRYEGHDWWLVRRFTLPADWPAGPSRLVFAGLDTLATVWLNGTCLGQAANMLIEHSFAASQALLPGGENVLVVRLASALAAARGHEYDAIDMSWEHRAEGLHLRKAPHVWGWDILPRAVSAGLWRPVWLESLPAEAIEQLYYWTLEAAPDHAVLGAWFQFRTSAASLEGFSLHFRGVCQAADGGSHAFSYEWPVEFLVDHCAIPIPGARLWWPAGYGAPDLYTVTAQLCRDGQVLAERVDQVGLRRLVVDRTELAGAPWQPEPASGLPARLDSPPDPASHFVISVNGERTMVKGTNWVPLDAFHSRDAGRLEQAIGLVIDLGCNMVRCWGGNVYESDAFFAACDAAGILVWQDFAFACCRYPQTVDFLEQVRLEAEAVVRRLRNHPCLALWCGDNEVDFAYLSSGLDPAHNRLTRQVLPRVVQRCDPHRAYVPSSPYAPPAVLKSRDPWRQTPEQHLWGPRGYYKGLFYTQHSAHFIGEIGYHGCPSLESLRRFLSPAALEQPAAGIPTDPKNFPWSEQREWQTHAVYHWEQRAIDRDRIQLMANQVRELFGAIPADLESFILASQITQAEAKKFFIESTRLRKWQTSGILWWNLLDGWPQFSDAVVDYFFEKKLAYHYIWRAQRPLCLFMGEPGAGKYLPLIVSNDTRQSAELSYQVRDAEAGAILAQGRFTSPPNQNWQVERLRTFASDQRLYLIEWALAPLGTGGAPQKFGNHYLSGTPPFDLLTYRGWLAQIAALPRPFKV
jgi:beta-mannosidase